MIEVEQFGWNVITVAFLVTMIVLVLGSWGLWEQNKKIWKNKSGLAVSVNWFSTFFFMFFMFIPYGWEINSLAMVLTGAGRVLFIAPILIGLFIFKDLKRQEIMVIVLMISIVFFSVFLPSKAPTYMFLTGVGILGVMTQPLEMHKEKRSDLVSIRLLLVNFSGVFFWALYGLIIGNLPIFTMSFLYCLVYVWTITLWFLYRNRNTSAP